MLRGISIASQAEAEEALELVESEAFSLIESHASVTRKALQSRNDLGATEPQSPLPPPVPLRRPCLSSLPSLVHGCSLRGSRGRGSAPHLVQGHHTQASNGLKNLGGCMWYFMVLVFIAGTFCPRCHLPDMNVSPQEGSGHVSHLAAPVGLLHPQPP